MTSSLPMKCSTTELLQHRNSIEKEISNAFENRMGFGIMPFSLQALNGIGEDNNQFDGREMGNKAKQPSEPLKNALRENLKKRKMAVRKLKKSENSEFSARQDAIEQKPPQ